MVGVELLRVGWRVGEGREWRKGQPRGHTREPMKIYYSVSQFKDMHLKSI